MPNALRIAILPCRRPPRPLRENLSGPIVVVPSGRLAAPSGPPGRVRAPERGSGAPGSRRGPRVGPPWCRVALPTPGGSRRCAGCGLSARLAPEPPGPRGIIRRPAPPDPPHDPEHFRRQLDDCLEAGVPIALPLGFQGREAGPARGGPREPHRRVVERPAQEPAAALRNPRLARVLPGLHPDDVQPRELPELAEAGEPGDVADLRQEDGAHGGPDPRDRPEEPVGGEPFRQRGERLLNGRDPGLHGGHLGPEIRTGGRQAQRQAPLGHRRAAGGRPLPGLEDRGELRPEALRERLAHGGQSWAQRGAPAGFATRQLGPSAAEAPDQVPQLREGPRGLAVEEDLALLQEVGAVGRVLPIVLVPGPVLGPPVPVGHAAGEEDHVGALGFEERGDRLVVGPGGLQAANDLVTPGRPLRLLDPRPELREAPGGVRNGECRRHHPGVGVAEVDHMLGLGDVEPDQEALPIRPQGRLQIPEPLDTGGIVSHSLHGVLPPLFWVSGWPSSHRYGYRGRVPFGSCHFHQKGIRLWESIL
jgi:hypothetical protein